jgi:hypothetical protein
MQEKLSILWWYKKILLNWVLVCGLNMNYLKEVENLFQCEAERLDYKRHFSRSDSNKVRFFNKIPDVIILYLL